MASQYPSRRARLIQTTNQVGADRLTVSQDPNVLYGEYALLSLPAGSSPTSGVIERVLGNDRFGFQQGLAGVSPFTSSALA